LGKASCAAVLLAVSLAGSAAAQEPARFSIDSTVAADVFRGQGAADRPNIIIDITGVVRLSDGWTAYVRPWLRQPRANRWDKEIYQAALQYERHGRVSTRVSLGSIVSPVGLGLMDTRPGVNPTILPHLSYFTPMPPLEAGEPAVPVITSTYPLGGEVTFSGRTWDARAALVNSAPNRLYIINNTGVNPDATPVVEGGAGITPKVGLRIGASFARGRYATASELKVPSKDGETMTLVGIEGDYAFAFTHLSGELLRDTFTTDRGHVAAYEWFVQGMQTITPRWFAAGRQEGTSAPPPFTATTSDRRFFLTSEATLGYRVSPEVSFRASFYARKPFARSDWDQQAGVSVVWAHRLW
jgi:hypothetical protein